MRLGKVRYADMSYCKLTYQLGNLLLTPQYVALSLERQENLNLNAIYILAFVN